MIPRALMLSPLAACAALCVALAPPALADAFDTLGDYLAAREAGDIATAGQLAGRLATDNLRELGLSNADERAFRLELAEARAAMGDLSGAVSIASEVLDGLRADDAAARFDQVEVLRLLARWKSAQGRTQAAREDLDAAIAIAVETLGRRAPTVRRLRQERAALRRPGGRDAEEEFAEAEAAADVDGFESVRDEAPREAPEPPSPPDVILSEEAANGQRRSERSLGDTRSRSAGDGEAEDGFELVEVFYGTNRAPTGRSEPTEYYGGERGALETGVVTVSVPEDRELGSIPKPSIWRLEFRPDPQKHVIVTDLQAFPNLAAFTTRLRETVRASERREAFVYIHGFNNDFDAAAERTAQLAVDLELDGAPILYSWPSRGRVFGYIADGASVVRPVVLDLERFLTLIAQESGAERIHVVAHSMGNRYLMAALEEMAEDRRGSAPPLFDEVVFAAPDVDSDDFAARLPGVQSLGDRMTLYASAEDRALLLSKRLNGGYRRAGDAAAPVVLSGLDTVDTTPAPRSNLRQGAGHDDVFEEALDDFRSLVWFSLEPGQRCILRPRERGAERIIWSYEVPDPRRCDADVYGAAILTLRRRGCEATLELLNGQVDLTTAARDWTNAQRWTNVRDIAAQACAQ